MTVLDNSWLIVVMPLAAFAAILFYGKKLPGEGAFLGIAAAGYALLHSLFIAAGIYNGSLVLPHHGPVGPSYEMVLDWFTIDFARFELGVLIDGLSSVMLVVVTLVSFLVQVYSLGYQKGKPRFGRYYAYISLFTFAMLLLTVANNLLQFFAGWELVGLCSYLLIGFEFEREEAAYAGRKAFITTKVGDLGFYAGLLLLFTLTGTFNIAILANEHVGAGMVPHGLAAIVAILFFCGAIGKSAQIPLHVWLPDAMEGPTPVSALIHAATMVAAGVYMVARLYFLFQAAPEALTVVAWIGGLTAFFAATMAIVSDDIKRILAFSTVSQLGYMMLGLGVGGYSAGMFHLTTHAVFKALLFLGAGSVIHAVHTNNIWHMGGLSRKMPVTFLTFGAATLAISGFPGFSGFYSKDAILEASFEYGPKALFILAVVTAFMTAFYMARLFFVVFVGTPRKIETQKHVRESPATMQLPLIVLGFLALASGFFLKYVWPFENWVKLPQIHETLGVPAAGHAGTAGHAASGGGLIGWVSVFLFAAGTFLAWSIYIKNKPSPDLLAAKFKPLHVLCTRRYYVDEVYLWLIEKFVWGPARILGAFDLSVLDKKIVDGFAAAAMGIAKAKRWFDDVIIDRLLVNGVGVTTRVVGFGFSALQSGFTQFYLLILACGLGLLALWALRIGG